MCASAFGGTKEVGTDYYKLQGFEKSLFNDFQYDSALTKEFKGQVFAPKKDLVKSFNYKGEPETHASDYQFTAYYFLYGSYKGKTGHWLVFEFPDQSVQYRRAHRMVFLDELKNIQSEVLQQKADEKLERQAKSQAYFNTTILPAILKYIAAIVLCILIAIFFKRRRIRQEKECTKLFEPYFAQNKLVRLIRVTPFLYTHREIKFTGTYSGTVQYGRVNVTENTRSKTIKFEALKFDLINTSEEKYGFSLTFNYTDRYGVKGNDLEYIQRDNVRPREPFSLVLLKPKGVLSLNLLGYFIDNSSPRSVEFERDINNKLRSFPRLDFVLPLKLLCGFTLLVLGLMTKKFDVSFRDLPELQTILVLPIHVVYTLISLLGYRVGYRISWVFFIISAIFTTLSPFHPLICVLWVLIICLERAEMHSASDSGIATVLHADIPINDKVIREAAEK